MHGPTNVENILVCWSGSMSCTFLNLCLAVSSQLHASVALLPGKEPHMVTIE